MKARTLTAAYSLPISTMSVLSLVALASISGPADARNCAVMPKPPAYWNMPMHHRPPQAMPYGQRYIKPMRKAPSVIAVAKRKGDFGTLLTAVEAAGLTGLLEGDGPYTLFAPTDAAFEKLPEGALQELLADKAKLIALLKQHVVPGRVTAVEVLESRQLDTASGQPVPTAELNVIRADIPAGNGIIHVIDTLILTEG